MKSEEVLVDLVSEVRARIDASLRRVSRPWGCEFSFAAMGTTCRVVAVYARAEGTLERDVIGAVVDWVARFEARYSRFLRGSLISRINDEAGEDWVGIDPETERLLGLCGQLVHLTQGILDPTTLPLVRLWEWREGRVPDEVEVERARELTGWKKVERRPGGIRLPKKGMALDLGGVGKEYAVDQVVMLVAGMGVRGLLVDFGADVRVLGMPPEGREAWVIGLEDPTQRGRAWCQLLIRDGAVATSGIYVRKFEVNGRTYGHVIDPRSGLPVDNGVLAASVIAPSCTQAGMLSTSALVLGREEGRRLIESSPQAEGCVVSCPGTVSTSRFYEYVAS